MNLISQITFGQQFIDSTKLVTATAENDEGSYSDFDFEIGTWKTELKRLQNPLSGNTKWLNYEGTTNVKKIMNGKANILEFNVRGPGGIIEAVSLRLYHPATKLWSVHFANISNGSLTVPAVGGFKDGRAEFYNEDSLNGRKILVRFIISNITAETCHFEQSFSIDNGMTWEVNWIADDRRVTEKFKSKSVAGKRKHEYPGCK
jgi:hypothetical protein